MDHIFLIPGETIDIQRNLGRVNNGDFSAQVLWSSNKRLSACARAPTRRGSVFGADFLGPGDIVWRRPGCVGSCRFPAPAPLALCLDIPLDLSPRVKRVSGLNGGYSIGRKGSYSRDGGGVDGEGGLLETEVHLFLLRWIGRVENCPSARVKSLQSLSISQK
jgi:hypothetical protein